MFEDLLGCMIMLLILLKNVKVVGIDMKMLLI